MRGSRRLLGFVLRAVVLLGVEGLLLVALTALLPGVESLSFGAALLVAGALALINAVLWPIVTRLALPLTILTFGLASLLLSAGAVALAFYVVDGKSPPFWETWRSPSDWPSCRCSPRPCSMWTATPITCASSGDEGDGDANTIAPTFPG